jgi:ABC-type transport system involved in multi-copper enzyme maturation permease subunit
MGRQLSAFVVIELKHGVRDRVIHAILAVGVLLLLSTPVVAVFSMRQVLALAVSYSLSVISLLGLLLTVFLGLGVLSRDMERRTVYTVCSLPISRSVYLLGRFLGFALLVLVALAILSFFAAGAISVVAFFYPPDPPFSWGTFGVALWFRFWIFLIVGAVIMVFSAFSTSTFLPLALSVGIYFASFSTEAVKYYVESGFGRVQVAPGIRWLAHLAYWVLPNFSAFDLMSHAIHHLPLDPLALLLTQLYGIGYVGLLLVLAAMILTRREFL